MEKIAEANITESEWEVMRVIWAQQTTTSQFIIDVLSDKMDWKPATIKTLLGRLVKKAFIGTKKDGKRYLYYPLVFEQDATMHSVEHLLNQVCSTKVGTTIAQLIQEAPLSFEDVALIEETLKKKIPVEKVTCTCVPGQCECC